MQFDGEWGMEIRTGRDRGRWWFWACPALPEGGDEAEGMTCFSAVLISRFFSVPFIRLDQAGAGLPRCCKSPLLRWLWKTLSVKDISQAWSPLAKRGVDLCNDLHGVPVGLGTSQDLTACSHFPVFHSIREVKLLSFYFSLRVFFFFPSPICFQP